MNRFLEKQANNEIYKAILLERERAAAEQAAERARIEEAKLEAEHDETVGGMAALGTLGGAAIGGSIPAMAFGTRTPLRGAAALAGAATGGLAGLVGVGHLADKVDWAGLHAHQKDVLNPAVEKYQAMEEGFRERALGKEAFAEMRYSMDKIAAYYGG